MANVLPSVTGLTGKYFGAAGGSTTRYYQVQAIYPDGRSGWVYITVTGTPAGLDSAHRVLVSWDPMPGAIGYDVVQTANTSTPSGTATIGESVGRFKNSFEDVGLALFSYTAISPTQYLANNDPNIAHFKYDFAVDGGGAGTITPAQSDTVPANAIVVEAFFAVTTALAGTSGGTVALGIGSTHNSLLTATAYGSVTGIVKGVPQTTAFQQAAAGQINVTIATHDLTAGVIEGWVRYFPAGAAVA